MAKIIRAEFLSYYNSAQNSDKVFNIFLIEEDKGSFSCLTENGRRGHKLVRRTLCSGEGRSIAEGKLRQKLLAKRNHRSTPYSDDQFGFNYSNLVDEYELVQTNNSSNSEVTNQASAEQTNPAKSKNNVIDFPVKSKKVKRQMPKNRGLLNKSQFDSLEI